MSPVDRRRRRARPATVVGIALVVLVLALLVGGLVRVGAVSTSYWRSVDRSYAAQGAVVVDQSNQTAGDLRRLLAGWTSQTRRALESTLDLLVRTTDQQAQAAAALSPPEPWGSLGPRFAAVLADRARAAADLRSAVDGLLGMAPLPIQTAQGATNPETGGANGSVVLTASQAASALGRVGALLEQADRTYGRVRHGFARAPGGARLPASRWVRNTAGWSSGPALTAAEQLAGAPKLAARHQVVLVPTAIDVTPAPVPTPGASAGAATLPPTSSLRVTVVVANDGNVGEHGLVVTASVQPAAGGRTSQRTASVALAPGASEAVGLGVVPIVAGRSYQLTVAVTPPAGEVPGSTTSRTFAVKVAPNSAPPPTTTTTTTAPPRSSRHPTTTTTRPGAGSHPTTTSGHHATTTTTAPRSGRQG